MKKASNIIDQIKDRLDSIEDMMYWTIRCDQRFAVGQTVQLSASGKRKGMRFKHGVERAKIIELLPPFLVRVKIKGYKHSQTMHHGFFDVPRAKRAINAALSGEGAK